MRAHFKLTWVMLLLLTFMSQAMASSMMAYKMMANNIALENVSSVKNHATSFHHQMNEMSMGTKAHHKKNCCSKQSTCVIVACSVVALINDVYIQHIVSVSTLEYSRYSEMAFSQQAKSLYRPPISS